MKLTYYLLCMSLCVAFSQTGSAQPYESIFGDNSTEWVFRWSNLPGTYTDTAFIEKDTTVNGVAYKKVITRYGNFKGGLLREDTDSGIVWYRDIEHTIFPDDTVETIAFRYDLNVGDTFDISNVMLQKGSYHDSLNIVDSVKTIGGLKYIYFKGQYQSGQNFKEPFTIIEGIGSNIGIFWKYYAGVQMNAQYLLCSYKDGIKTSYINRYYNGKCQVFGNVNSINKDSDITIYPQPATNVLYIKNDSKEQIINAQLLNQVGQVLINYTSNTLTSISLSSVPSGMYILKLHSKSGYIYNFSIIKS